MTQSFRPAGALAKEEYKLKCATCSEEFMSRNDLHRHIREMRHQKRDDVNTASQAMQDHFRDRCKPNDNDIQVNGQQGFVKGLPPVADETGDRLEYEQQVRGQIAGESKPDGDISSMSRAHPGPLIKEAELAPETNIGST